MPTFYLKKYNDIILHGHLFDEYCFNIDKDAFDVNLGKAPRDYEEKEIIGNGVYLRDKYAFKKRKIQINVQYYARNNEQNALNQERMDFLKDWLLTDDTIYFYREHGTDVGTDLQRIEIKLVQEGDEKFKNSTMGFNQTNDIGIELKTKKPLFESTTEQVFNFTKDSFDQTFEITNNGATVPFQFKMTFLNGCNSVFVRLYENICIQVLDYINAGSILEFDTSNMIFKINDSIRNLNISGTPFGFSAGLNKLKVRAISNGSIQIKFNERHP